MPRYDFKCMNCKETTEAITKPDVEYILCEHCEEFNDNYLAKRQLSAPACIHIH